MCTDEVTHRTQYTACGAVQYSTVRYSTVRYGEVSGCGYATSLNGDTTDERPPRHVVWRVCAMREVVFGYAPSRPKHPRTWITSLAVCDSPSSTTPPLALAPYSLSQGIQLAWRFGSPSCGAHRASALLPCCSSAGAPNTCRLSGHPGQNHLPVSGTS